MDPSPEESRSPRFIARQLSLGFGSVSALAIAMCGLLISVVYEVAGHVEAMRHDESSIRQGMELASAVRGLSERTAHALIARDSEMPPEYARLRDRVRARIQTLAARLPAEERPHLQKLAQATQRMDNLMTDAMLPATARSDDGAAREAFQQIEGLARDAERHADALAAATTSQMAHAHDHATSSTRLGLLGGGLFALLIVALSVTFTVRLRAVVLQPLKQLTDAALRYGRGDFAFRMHDVGKGELAAVGDAFSRMADELARREARLVHSERMAAIGQLAAGIAHELNNPIGIIRGYLKTMSPEEDAQTLGEELAILDEEATHCQRLAADLLSYARAEELSLEALAMDTFLAEASRRYGVSPAAVAVRVDAVSATLEVDGARLRQVILNLLNNAAQVSPEGTQVQVVGRVDGADYRIDVVDHGPGVPLEERQRIFEPFYSKRRGGSGLGLAVCEGIVRAHQGSIEVDDAPHGGALFRIRLPLEQRKKHESITPLEAPA